jgi:MFS family permease
MTPPEIRGMVMSFWQLFYSVGAFIAYSVAYACAKHKATLGNWDWKMVVIFQMLVLHRPIHQMIYSPINRLIWPN